jgi:hypothetical protein
MTREGSVRLAGKGQDLLVHARSGVGCNQYALIAAADQNH